MSTEDSVISNLKTTLQSINGSPTYTNTMMSQQVEARAVYEDDIPDDAWPHFSIVFRDSQREKQPGTLKKILSIDIVASFINPLAGDVAAWIADIEKVLSVDISRGGFAYETWIPSILRNSDVLDEIQVYIISVEVRTITNFGTL